MFVLSVINGRKVGEVGMNENDALKFQDLMQGLSDLIEHKDVQIAEQFEKGFHKGENKGFEDGTEKAWSLAKRIVNLKWDGALVETCNTVEDWFDMCFEDASEAMAKHDMCLVQKPKAFWEKDFVRHVLECSECGFATLVRTPYCGNCGAEMGEGR